MENNSIGNAERNGKGVKFERIRRITGYLVGAVDRWNDAKKAELNDRVISTHNKSYTGSARGERASRALFFFLGGKPLKDIKTRERHDRAELPKTLRHAPKELAQKGLRAAKEKGKEQLQQAAQNGMGGVEQVSPEENSGDQLLGRAEEWGGTVTAGGRDMLRRIPARANADRQANRLEKQRGNAPGGQNAPQAHSFKEKSTRKLHAQQGEAHVLKTGRPAVKAARQPVKTPQAIHAAKQQAAHTAKQAAQRAKRAARAAQQTAKSAGRTIANIARTCIAAVKNLVAALAAGGGLALFIVLLICLIALVAGSAFGIFFSSEPTGKGMTMKQAVQTLNEEYYQKLKEIEAETPHDQVEYISEGGSVSIHWEDILAVPFPVSWTVKMKKKQKETQDILSYHSQAAGCSDKARAKASGGRQPIEECGRTGL